MAHSARRVLGTMAGLVVVAWVVAALVVFYPQLLNAAKLLSRPANDPVVTPPHVLQVLGDPSRSGLGGWPGLFDGPPTSFDINGDGVDEIIAQSNDTNVYVFDARTGRVLATLPTTTPPGWYVERVLNGVGAARLRPGDPVSLVVTSHAAYVAVWQFVAPESDGARFAFRLQWERHLDDCFAMPSMDASPELVDLDGDGVLEILVQTEEVGLFALDLNGATRWHHCWAGGNSAPVAEDLDGDGRPEAIFASDDGRLLVLRGLDGAPQWSFDAAAAPYGIHPASISVSPTVAELDGQWPREIFLTARHAPREDPAAYGSFHMAIFAVRQDLQTGQAVVLWMRQPEWAHPLSYTRLLVEDVDHDGAADIFGMDWNTIGHSPGHWEPLGPAHLFRLTKDGHDVWVQELDTWWSNKDIALGDFDHDGDADLIVNGQHEAADGLWRIDPATGRGDSFYPVGPWKVMRGPVVADLFHDGRTQFVFPVASDEPIPTRTAILLLEPGP